MTLRHLTVVLALAAVLACTGCATVYSDQVPLGPNTRLTVGGKQGFFGSIPKVWVIENGEEHEVELVEGGGR